VRCLSAILLGAPLGAHFTMPRRVASPRHLEHQVPRA